MSYFGTLIARVFTSRSELPIADAAVSIVLHQPGCEQKLLSIQTSDSSGGIPPVKIKAPNPKDSQSPNQNAPYTLCDLWAEHQAYQLLHIQNIPIFSGVVSIQDLPLIPLTEHGDSFDNTVTISPQDL